MLLKFLKGRDSRKSLPGSDAANPETHAEMHRTALSEGNFPASLHWDWLSY